VKALVTVAAGVVTERRAEENADGTFDNTETKKTELAVADAVTEATGDLIDARTKTVAKSQSTASAKTPGLSAPGTANAKITSVVNQKTPGALIDVTEQEEVPGAATVETIDLPFDGDKTVKIVIFRNHTKTALQALLVAAKYYRVSPGVQLNRFGLLDGTLTLSIDAGGGGGDGSYELITDEPYTQTTEQIISIAGKWYKRVVTYTHSIRRDWGVDSGIALYSGAKSGSEFRLLSGGWYHFDKVTAISVTDTLITVPASAVAL
jgi:hypothetical protein